MNRVAQDPQGPKNPEPRNPKSEKQENREMTLIMDAETVVQIPLADIAYVVPNHRTGMDEGKLAELAESIGSTGVLQPIKVCKRDETFVMIFGHRRVKASELAGMDTVPAIVETGWSDEQIAEAQVIENILREDLNPIEEAQCIKTLLAGGNDLDTAASKMNKSVAWCRERHDLLRLDKKVQALVASYRLPLGHAKLIARVGNGKDQRRLASGAVGDKDSDYLQPRKDLRQQISYLLCKLGAARWPKDVKYAGKRPCNGCVDNTNTEPTLFEGITLTSAKGNCTNAACFATKGRAWEKDPVKIERDKKRDEARRKKLVAEGKDPDDVEAGAKGGESYEARNKRVAGLKRKFPWTPEQALAVAQHDYMASLAEVLYQSMDDDKAMPDDLACMIGMFMASGTFANMHQCQVKLTPKLFCELLCDKSDKSTGYPNLPLPAKTAPELFNLWQASFLQGTDPYVDWEGEIQRVPLPDHTLLILDCLEAIVRRWGVKFDMERPTAEGIAARQIILTIRKGKKPEATAAIAGIDNVAVLDQIEAAGLKAKWRAKLVADRREELAKAS